MKFFDKTLEEINEIVIKINDELGWCEDGKDYLSFKTFGYNCVFEFNGQYLIDADNHVGWGYNEETDEYEDIEITVREMIKTLTYQTYHKVNNL